MSAPKQLTLAELYKIREAYRHFQSTSDFIRAIDELIAVREAPPITVNLSGEVSWEQEQYREEVIEILRASGIAVDTSGCGHSPAFRDASGAKRCSLCDAADVVIEGK